MKIGDIVVYKNRNDRLGGLDRNGNPMRGIITSCTKEGLVRVKWDSQKTAATIHKKFLVLGE